MPESSNRLTRGISILEILVTLGVLGIVLGIAAINLRPLSNDASNAAAETAGFLRQARARAMATTSAVRVVYVSATRLRTETAPNCNAASGWSDARLNLNLEQGARLISNWNSNDTVVCFSSRGFTNSNITLNLQDNDGRTAALEILLGGGVEIQ
jgi:Tfp pilus assembly protein FimT